MQRSLLIVSVVVLLSALAVSADDKTLLATLFASFKTRYNRTYSSPQEEAERMAIYQSNLIKAAQLQASEPYANFGENLFADVSEVEFAVRINSASYYNRLQSEVTPAPTVFSEADLIRLNVTLGDAVDWRSKGAVVPVKDQGGCGSCWAFAAAGTIESAWAISGRSLVGLSEQQLVSCDKTDGACAGGHYINAFNWLVSQRAGKITTSAAYPYVSGGASVPACADAGKAVGATITGQRSIPQDEAQMAAYLASYGPIAVAIDAGSWQSYTGGILTNCRSTTINHGVIVVGMGVSGTMSYWIVRNSWSSRWGEAGYIRLQRGTNQCLIKNYPVQPIVAPMPATPAPPKTPAPTTAAPKTPAPTTAAPKTPAPVAPASNCTAKCMKAVTTLTCKTTTSYTGC